MPKSVIKSAQSKLSDAATQARECKVEVVSCQKLKDSAYAVFVEADTTHRKAHAEKIRAEADWNAARQPIDSELLDRVRDTYELYRHEQVQVDSLERLQAHYTFWRKGFGPQGVRADALAAATVALSQEVNRWYAKLGDTRKVSLVWDDLGRLQITVGWLEFENLSHGEKQRLDVAIMLALMQLTVQGTGFNLRVFDDPFSGVDAAGCTAMLDAWRELPGTSFVLVPELQAEWEDRIDKTIYVQKTSTGTRIQ